MHTYGKDPYLKMNVVFTVSILTAIYNILL